MRLTASTAGVRCQQSKIAAVTMTAMMAAAMTMTASAKQAG